MELILNRKLKLADRTIGELCVNGVKICDTLEDTERLTWSIQNGLRKLLGTKIYGATAIPSGRYEIAITYSERFKKKLPLLLNVPGFEGIRIHAGNIPADTHGCLLCGTYDPKTKNIINSKLAIAKVQSMIENAKGKVFITINS